jgi:divalent metal cation (Fe/Co/Zn/Cd) transporter
MGRSGTAFVGMSAVTSMRQRRWGTQALLMAGLWLTVLTLAMKLWVGWATQSLSLLAAALHTLIVSFSLVLSLLELWLPQTGSRPLWGHGKLEAGLTLLLVGFVSVIGFGLVGVALWEFPPPVALTIYHHPQIDLPVRMTVELLQLLAGMVAVGLGVGWVGRSQAKALDSTSLSYSFRYSLYDTGLMVAVLLALWGVYLGFDWLDPGLTGLLVLMVLCTAWQMLNHQLPSLFGQVAIAPEALVATIRQVEGVLHCYNIRSRGMVGRLIYVELSLILHPEFLSIAPSLCQRIDRLIQQQYGPAKVVLRVESKQ